MRRSVRFAVLVVAAGTLFLGGCGAVNELSRADADRAAGLGGRIAAARQAGAEACAPRELARANALVEHARHEAMEYHDPGQVDRGFRVAAEAVGELEARVRQCQAARKRAVPPDADKDGVVDDADRCPGTPAGVAVDPVGCPRDADRDGVADYLDRCPDTPQGAPVDAEGCLADTDGDRLTDWDETRTHRTDPNNPDTDADRLRDGDEVQKYRTDPLRPDTDGDGLGDGDEVLTYRTDPNNPDTDGGSVADGLEVAVAGTDPLDPEDDVKQLKCVDMQINFDTDSDVVKPEYMAEVERVARYLKDFPELKVVIQGHTDNRGTTEYNLDLSLRRAKSVIRLLAGRYGIDPGRLKAEGFGASQPIATNDNEEGRARNRRIYAILRCE